MSDVLKVTVPVGFDADFRLTEEGSELRISTTIPIYGARTIPHGKPPTQAQLQRRADAIVRDLRKLERVMLDAAERHAEGGE